MVELSLESTHGMVQQSVALTTNTSTANAGSTRTNRQVPDPHDPEMMTYSLRSCIAYSN